MTMWIYMYEYAQSTEGENGHILNQNLRILLFMLEISWKQFSDQLNLFQTQFEIHKN